MLRQSIRRCAGLASGAGARAVLLAGTRAAFPVTQKSVAALTRSRASFNSFEAISRLYSTEAAAVESPETEEPVATATEDPRFGDLTKLGVHPNLLDAITKDMGYDTMTDVQAKTITPALKGTDM